MQTISLAQFHKTAKPLPKRIAPKTFTFRIEVMRAVSELKTGEVLQFAPAEWVIADTGKAPTTSPRRYLKQYATEHGITLEVMTDGSGNYLVHRSE